MIHIISAIIIYFILMKKINDYERYKATRDKLNNIDTNQDIY
jgi:hypothetical protein